MAGELHWNSDWKIFYASRNWERIQRAWKTQTASIPTRPTHLLPISLCSSFGPTGWVQHQSRPRLFPKVGQAWAGNRQYTETADHCPQRSFQRSSGFRIWTWWGCGNFTSCQISSTRPGQSVLLQWVRLGQGPDLSPVLGESVAQPRAGFFIREGEAV